MLGLIYVFTALGIASHVLSAPTDHPAQMIIPDSMTAYLELAENVFQRHRPMPLYFAEKLNQYGEIIMTANRSAALQVQFRNFTQWSEKDATIQLYEITVNDTSPCNNTITDCDEPRSLCVVVSEEGRLLLGQPSDLHSIPTAGVTSTGTIQRTESAIWTLTPKRQYLEASFYSAQTGEPVEMGFCMSMNKNANNRTNIRMAPLRNGAYDCGEGSDMSYGLRITDATK